MTARGRDGGEAPDPMAGEDLVSLLYGELEPDEQAKAEARVSSDAAMSARLGEMRRVRDLFSSMEEEEPPSRLTAQLLAEAARSAPQVRRDEPRVGFWARLNSWLQPLVQRPALAAAASLVLVGGVAGVLYLRKGDELTRTREATELAETGSGTDTALAPTAPPPPATPPATEAADELTGSQAGEYDLDAPAEPEKPAESKPAAKRKRAASSSKADNKLVERSQPKGRPAMKSGTVLGLSEQEIVPRDQAPAAADEGGVVGGASGRAESPAPSPSAEPAPSPPPAPAGDRSGKAPARPSVRELHNRAIDAAMDRRCAEVKVLAGQVRASDSVYYSRSFAADKRLKACLASPSKAPAKK